MSTDNRWEPNLQVGEFVEATARQSLEGLRAKRIAKEVFAERLSHELEGSRFRLWGLQAGYQSKHERDMQARARRQLADLAHTLKNMKQAKISVGIHAELEPLLARITHELREARRDECDPHPRPVDQDTVEAIEAGWGDIIIHLSEQGESLLFTDAFSSTNKKPVWYLHQAIDTWMATFKSPPRVGNESAFTKLIIALGKQLLPPGKTPGYKTIRQMTTDYLEKRVDN